jgi:hypothetical protein
MRSLFLVLLIYSLPLWAAGKDFERNTDLQQDTRGISSITDIVPGLDDLDCTPKCEGKKGCGDFHDMSSCLDNDKVSGCFWSCE